MTMFSAHEIGTAYIPVVSLLKMAEKYKLQFFAVSRSEFKGKMQGAVPKIDM